MTRKRKTKGDARQALWRNPPGDPARRLLVAYQELNDWRAATKQVGLMDVLDRMSVSMLAGIDEVISLRLIVSNMVKADTRQRLHLRDLEAAAVRRNAELRVLNSMNDTYRSALLEWGEDDVIARAEAEQRKAPAMSEPKAAPVDKLCESCEGSGVFFEDHGQGMVEPLGCPDCEATGFYMCWDHHFCCDDREEHSHFLNGGQCPACATIAGRQP